MDQQVPDFVLFLGRFHPLIVHLPVGILLYAFLLEITARFTKKPRYRTNIPFALLIGTISAAFACLLGYMLSQSGDYEGEVLDLHFWFGIATTVIALLAYLFSTGKFIKSGFSGKPYLVTIVLTTLSLSLTGHFGGSLTHGEDYLLVYAPFTTKKEEKVLTVDNFDDALVYDDFIRLIIDNKCVSCHRSGKQKGQLSMETYEALMKGGEHGEIIVSGELKKSELIRRVTLPSNDVDFMPPDGKTPLTEDEKQLIEFWIKDIKADAKITVSQAGMSDEIKAIAMAQAGLDAAALAKATLSNVAEVNISDLNALQKAGFNVRELYADSNLYDIDLPVQAITPGDEIQLQEKLTLLVPLKNNIQRLSLDGLGLSDIHLKVLNDFKNLQYLKLEKNSITDKGLVDLTQLNNLKSLNVYGTLITKDALMLLEKIESLEHIFVWNTKITEADIVDFKKGNNKLVIQSDSY